MIRSRFVLPMTLVCLGFSLDALAAREWTDGSGLYQRTGTLIRYEANQVWIKAENGKVIAIDYAKLSHRDQEYVKSAHHVSTSPTGGVDKANSGATDGSNLFVQVAQQDATPQNATQPYTPPQDTTQPEATTTPAAGLIFKRVFSGPRGTFHLISSGGTVHYHLVTCNPDEHCSACHHCHRTSYLASLTFSRFDEHFLYYNVSNGDPATIAFAIARNPWNDDYSVFRHTREGWTKFGSFCREIPR